MCSIDRSRSSENSMDQNSSAISGAQDADDDHHGQFIEIAIAESYRDLISREAIRVASDFQYGIEIETVEMARAGEEILQKVLPKSAWRSLARLSKKECAAVTLRGLFKLNAPPTPVNGVIDDNFLTAHDIILAGALRIAGTSPTAFNFENSGRIARNVVANPERSGQPSSHGYDVELYFHQDNCGQPFPRDSQEFRGLPPMPEQLGFLGIRNIEQVPTRMLFVDDLLSILPTHVIASLSQPSYRIGAPASVASDGQPELAISHAPILKRRDGNWCMRYDPFLVMPEDPVAAAANAALILALAKSTIFARDLILNDGDLLIFENSRLLHMRGAFRPAPFDQSRWLRRFYGAATT